MAAVLPPSTPKSSPSVDTQSPGKWQHPRLREIVRRQNATTFDNRNIQRILVNGGALIVTMVMANIMRSYAQHVTFLSQLSTYPDLVFLVLRILFLVNIAIALYPLFRPKDDLSDIPLTPTQRALLGLNPNSTPPATPGTTYVTPPRYRLASGSRAGSTASKTTSPLSASGSPASRRASYSPTTSPLFQKALATGNRETSRRQSISSSSLSSSLRESSFGALPSTPSPLANKGNKLGLSNKWLYEKSRRHSAGNGVN